MKLRDFVVNSLPRVRSKKKTRSIPPPEVTSKGHHDTPPRPPIRMSSMSRESSVERASHVAVADVNWRQSPPRMGQDEMGLAGTMAYYGPPPGMVMSHSAEGISTHSLAVVAPQAQSLDYGKPYSQMAAISEGSMNYSMPRGFVIQSQHHHRHSHQHDYHYVYHHHHHHKYPSDPSARAPLMETNDFHQNEMNRCKAISAPHKTEPGFLRKSFASFKAMRKQRSNAKDTVAAKTKPGDENGKCTVCPYPQLHVMPNETKNKQSDTRPAKPKRKGLKSLRKSKTSKEEQLDKSWFSDNDASNTSIHNLSDADLFYHATTQRPRFRECSVESCMSRLNGSQDGSCGPETDYIGLDTHSLSGYESDLPRSKTGRTRSRIKTNPWLPSPQPSLNIGRRFEHCEFRESREDVMTVDDDYMSMPRSASFEHQRPTVLSSFQSASSKGRPITRHRSLTPSDLKITLSLSKTPKDAKPISTDLSHSPAHVQSGKASMNDLSFTVPKSRPSSIMSPSSEFVILADNIEQLANNISFEYEDMLDTTLESVSTCHEDGKVSIQELLTDEELTGNGKNNDILFSNPDQINDNAHSPDSGIGCLVPSDGDDLVAANATSSSQSPSLSSAYCVTPESNDQSVTTGEESKTNDLTETTGHKSGNESPFHNWSHPCMFPDQSHQHEFAIQSYLSSSNDKTAPSHLESVCPSTAGFHSDTNTPCCHNISNKSIPSSKMNLVNGRTHKYRHLKGHNCDTQRDLSEKLCFEATENNVSGDFVQSSSVHVERVDLNSNSLNDFQKTNTGTTFLKANLQSRNQEPGNLPPNITRSELTTPIESPTENWQCGVDFFSPFQKDFEQTLFKGLHKDDFDNEKINDKDDANFPSNEFSRFEIDQVIRDEGKEKSTSEAVNEIFGSLIIDRVDDTIENNSLDLADASVQTDFNDDEWQESSSNALEDLCDDDFDPIESTRRWLLTGNMQGSADTGYSSQPRDSQILMDDDDSITALDNYNDSKTSFSKNNSIREETPTSKVCSSEPIMQDKTSNIEKNGERSNLSERQSLMLKQSSDKLGQQSDSLVHSMFSGIESQFNDIFHQLWPSQNIPEHSTNKRDSSGSSTSTLISETIGGASITQELNELNELTPRNSFCEQKDFKVEDGLKHSHCFSDEKMSKKKKTTKNLEPDYVNVPRKGRSGKIHSNSGHICTSPELKNIEYTGNCKKCIVRNDTNTVGSELPFSFNNKDDGTVSTERADYLEFLKDAPLSNAHMKRPLFLIPGFGPIDMTPPSINHHGKPVRRAESSGFRTTTNTAKPVAKVSDSGPVQRIQSLISKGRSSSRSKWAHDKESHEPAHSCPSANGSTPNESHSHNAVSCKVLPEKPKRKNPRALQSKPCPSRTRLSAKLDQDDMFRTSSPVNKTASCHASSYPDTSTRSLAERVWQLQREKDLIYLQLREVQQEELSRQRQQLQHHRNVHSQRKDVLLETLRDLKANLEEQSRKLNLACNKDVYI